MSYYTGQGDYYSGKGDPGLFGFLGGVVKGVTGIASKVLPGPLGTAAGFVNRTFGGGGPSIAPISRMAPPLQLPAGVPMPGVTGFAERLIPGGATGVSAGCTPGWHTNKSFSYATNTPAGGKCVRNRSMNPANPKALRRAIRREKAFIGLARSALKGTGWRMTKSSARTAKRRGGRHRH